MKFADFSNFIAKIFGSLIYCCYICIVRRSNRNVVKPNGGSIVVERLASFMRADEPIQFCGSRKHPSGPI